ncbi:MAG TPA: hypothetical protein VNO22_00850 [Planctomycetota bacterium]|nr:hypothetical protein [Planctomycetota bacterium]
MILPALLGAALAAAVPQDDLRRYGVQEPRPLDPDTGRQVRGGLPDHWLYFALAPHGGPRHNGWSGFFHTPPLEEALGLPAGTVRVRLGVDLAQTDWSSDEEGGESRLHTAYLSQSLEVDYALSGRFLVGLRLSAGELGEGDDEPVRLYDGGQQIVPAGDRGFGLESVVARAKYVFSFGFIDLGFLGEVKFPLADEEDLLTAQTTDVGFSILATKRWGRFAWHFNVGAVLPLGDAELFTEADEADPYVHGGTGLSWLPWKGLALFAQVEFNSSPFAEAALLDGNVIVAAFGARTRVAGNVFFTGAAGFGLTEDSGDLILSTAVDVTF